MIRIVRTSKLTVSSKCVTLIAISGHTRYITKHILINFPESSEDDVVAEYMQHILLEMTDLNPKQLQVLLERSEWLRAVPALYFKFFDRLLLFLR